MTRVITYGTYDLIHEGHIRLLKRAKALGDFLIVGVTSDTFDRQRGKINVQQSLLERIQGVKATGLADLIIVEEYEGQKIDDIKRLNVDIFTVGSDWKGHFDYLNEYCKVVYLDRTEGISSSDIRAERHELRLGLIGESTILNKIVKESQYVNGMSISGIYSRRDDFQLEDTAVKSYDSLDTLADNSDALYIISSPRHHFADVKQVLQKGKHVLCESPIAISLEEMECLEELAAQQQCVLMDSIKTAYSLAYSRLCLLAKSEIIGDIVSVDAVSTSLNDQDYKLDNHQSGSWNSICAWGPTALLPVFQLLGTNYRKKTIVTHLLPDTHHYDTFSKISFVYPHAVASVKVGRGVKSEGELVISGTKGYIYVPAPWWKTDYFEVRYENASDNTRHFYPLEGEGLRFELLMFLKSVYSKKSYSYVASDISTAIVKVIDDFYHGRDVVLI